MIVWNDEMQTYSYIVSGNNAEGVIVKHIFTGNSEVFQKDAKKLLQEFQLEVPMQRKLGKASESLSRRLMSCLSAHPHFLVPYFEYTVGSTHDQQSLLSTWENAPPCVALAKKVLLDQGRGYGENRDVDINKLSVLAWVTSGTKKVCSSASHLSVHSLTPFVTEYVRPAMQE